MNNIEIYTRNLCSFCDRAKQVFNSYNLKFTEYNIYENPKYFKTMLKRSNGQRTMPQIFINSLHVGGYEHLKEIIDNGRFKLLIKK